MSNRLAFGRFALDIERGSLRSGDREIPLRPEAWAVLRFLAENPERLVTNDELLEAVWPGLIITDDSLVQRIRELRRALGDESERLIVTLPGRGYRFVPAAAPGERRKARGWQLLRWRWIYGILAPLLLAVTAVALLLIGRKPPPAADTKPAIAVLPFVYQGDDPQRADLADAVTQDLIDALGRIVSLTVTSWAEVSNYRGPEAMPGNVAHALDVSYEVEGSLRLTGARLRVITQLIDAQGRVLWSAQFDEDANALSGLEERIAREIAAAVAIRANETKRHGPHPPAVREPT